MKRIISFIMTLVLIAGLVLSVGELKSHGASIQLSSQQIADYFNNQVGKSVAERSCLAFVANGFQAMGAAKSTACCAYKYMLDHKVSDSMDNIPIGADVYILWTKDNPNYHSVRCPNKHICHHIAVYVGDGYIVQAAGGKVVKEKLSKYTDGIWCSFGGWGYHGNVEIVDGEGITSKFSDMNANSITSNDAAISSSLPSKPYCTEVGFYLSTNSNMSNAVKKSENANCQVAGLYYGMHKWYGNLNPNTTYYYQFYAIIGGSEYKSEVGSFTTVSDVQPADNLFSRIWAADVTDTSADLKGDLKAYHTIQDCGFQISTNPDMSGCITHYESERNNVNGVTISGFGYPSQNWYGALTKGTTYYYRLFIIEGGVTYMSSVQSFKTSGDSTPPVISSVTVTEIDASGYTLSVRTSDDSGIMKVAFPTWTDANGQDDLKGEWWNTTAVVTPNADGNYVYRINISDHSYESGKYITHVYAYDNNANTSYSPIGVSVYPLQNIYLSEKTIDVSSGDTRVIGVGLTPENTTDNGILTFSSSDTSIATVNEEGIITAISPGTAIITAQMSGKTATCAVKVDGGNNTGTDSEPVAMLRLYNPNSGEHFYTSSVSEKNKLVKVGWNYEGVAWEGPAKSNTPVYRLYNPNSGDHHYTPNLSERNKLIKIGWNDEGIGWYSDDSKGSPLYRLYNPNAVTGQHHYTMDTKERDKLIRIGWQDEGIGWYGK